MIKVRAKYDIYDGDIMYEGGKIYDVTEEQYANLKGHVTEVGYISEVFPPVEVEPPKTAGRRRKKG